MLANDPSQIAGLFAGTPAGADIRGWFRLLDFAVPDQKLPQATLQAFPKALKPFL